MANQRIYELVLDKLFDWRNYSQGKPAGLIYEAINDISVTQKDVNKALMLLETKGQVAIVGTEQTKDGFMHPLWRITGVGEFTKRCRDQQQDLKDAPSDEDEDIPDACS